MANEKAIVKSGNARFTVLTPEMIRIEYSENGKFEDRASFVVINRNLLVDDLSQRIKALLSKYENVLELLKEIPGVSTKVVEDLVSEIGLDMSHFPSGKHLSSRAGLSPGNNESAGKKKAQESLTETNK